MHKKYKTVLDEIDNKHYKIFKYDEKGFKNLSTIERLRREKE